MIYLWWCEEGGERWVILPVLSRLHGQVTLPQAALHAQKARSTHTHAHTRLARAFIMTHQDARAAAEHCTRQTRTWVTDLPSSRCALGKKRHGRRILFSRFQQSGVFLHGELGLTPSPPLYSLSQRNQNRKSNADVLFWKIIVKKKACDFVYHVLLLTCFFLCKC